MEAKITKKSLKGAIVVPSSKSHTIRAIVIATLAGGKSVINNPLPSDDCKAALRAAELFGAACTVSEGQWIVQGPEDGIRVPDDVVNVDNSGTTLYFMTSLAALLSDWTVFTGDKSIRSRPATPLLDALSQLGATATTTRRAVTSPPFMVKGPIRAGRVKVEGSPSQYISSLLLVAPLCNGTMRIETDNPMETPYLDLTIDWMRRTGVEVTYDEANYRYFEVKGPQRYSPFTRAMPSDWSSVAFPVVAGLTSGSELIVNNLDFMDKQGDAKVVDYLIEMGADIKKDLDGGRLIIKGGKDLHGITIDMAGTPDAVPILSVVGSLAHGITVLDNVAGARLKETDRVSVMVDLLSRMGADIRAEHNTITIHGGKPLKGTTLESYGDHRVAMALTAAGLFAEGVTTIRGAECASVTFPGFYEQLNALGADIGLQ